VLGFSNYLGLKRTRDLDNQESLKETNENYNDQPILDLENNQQPLLQLGQYEYDPEEFELVN